MFGLFKKSPEVDKEREAAIEQAKLALRKFVHDLADRTPEEIERKSKQIKEWCNSDKLVPFDFKQKALKRVLDIERSANMLFCDMRLHEAMDAAVNDDNKGKIAKVGEARRFFGRACTLGADADWRKAFLRAEENLLMSGGIHHNAPSRAKPADIAPRAPNRAKV
jgi:hypothetical protein